MIPVLSGLPAAAVQNSEHSKTGEKSAVRHFAA
jgi:hypothetical protein